MSETPQIGEHPAEHPAEHWLLRRAKQFWPVIPLVVILAALMMSDLGDFMGYSPIPSNSCALSDADQGSVSAKMYMPLAKWALRYTPTPSVAIIYIDPSHDPPDLLTNVCASRAFIARLIADLNALSAHVIVIDKFYSADACAEADKNTALMNAMESSKVPIVVGQSTHADSAKGAGCLALTPSLKFSKNSNVQTGLIRLDSDDLKIPLRVPLYTDPAADADTAQPVSDNPPAAPKQLPAASGDTLSLVAARVVNPDIESDPSVKKLLDKQIYPYTTFIDTLPHITGLTAICSAEASPRAPIDGHPGDALCKRWARPVDNLDGNHLNLASKIVIIGDLLDPGDMKPFPTDLAPFPPGKRPGVFLHANYIQSLLDHRFLVEIPTGVTWGLLVLYVLIIYCLYWAHDKDGIPLLNAEQAGLWSLAVLVCIAILSFIALVTMSYFTPLWALWGAGVFMVFRYLEATGHHRSQHLLGHLAGHHHASAINKENRPKRDRERIGFVEGMMEGIMVRIADVSGIIRSCAYGIAVAGCFGIAAAQPPAQPAASAPATPPKPATYSGCVQKAPEASGGGLIISTPTACARLTGDVSAGKLAGHQVELKGTLTLRTTSTPASIHVDSVVSVGASCSNTCSLRPPGTRSLHPPEHNETFGTEGGTPGLVAPPK